MRVSDLFGVPLLLFPRPNTLRNFIFNISERRESNLFFACCLFYSWSLRGAVCFDVGVHGFGMACSGVLSVLY
jgi:hypothetical protein